MSLFWELLRSVNFRASFQSCCVRNHRWNPQHPSGPPCGPEDAEVKEPLVRIKRGKARSTSQYSYTGPKVTVIDLASEDIYKECQLETVQSWLTNQLRRPRNHSWPLSLGKWGSKKGREKFRKPKRSRGDECKFASKRAVPARVHSAPSSHSGRES